MNPRNKVVGDTYHVKSSQCHHHRNGDLQDTPQDCMQPELMLETTYVCRVHVRRPVNAYFSDVENFPGYPKGIGGPEMMMELREQAERFGLEVRDQKC